MTVSTRGRWLTLANGFSGFLALPPGGSGPGLLLFQEIFGVNAHIRAVAQQYALDGFVVLAPDLFWRGAPRVDLGYEGEDRQRALGLMQGYALESAIVDIRVSTQALRTRPEVGKGRIGAIGYCMGGRMAYLAAAEAGVDAAVAYYGGGIHQMLDRADRIRAPMQFHFAGRDDHIPPEAVESVRTCFADKSAEVHTYPGALHGFNCWSRSSYHPASAARAHARSLGFLAAALWS
jgi:carboxymethylenebutenolidase